MYCKNGTKNLITSKEEIKQVCSLEPLKSTKAKILGMYNQKLAAVLPNRNNITVFGVAGSGKTAGYSFNQIVQAERAGESLVIVDSPRGEVFKEAKNYLQQKGYDIKMINVVDLHRPIMIYDLADFIDISRNKTAVFIFISESFLINNGVVISLLIDILMALRYASSQIKENVLPVSFIFDAGEYLFDNIAMANRLLNLAAETSRDIASFLINLQRASLCRDLWDSLMKMSDVLVMMDVGDYISAKSFEDYVGTENFIKLVHLEHFECIVKVMNSDLKPMLLKKCWYFERKEAVEMRHLSSDKRA